MVFNRKTLLVTWYEFAWDNFDTSGNPRRPSHIMLLFIIFPAGEAGGGNPEPPEWEPAATSCFSREQDQVSTNIFSIPGSGTTATAGNWNASLCVCVCACAPTLSCLLCGWNIWCRTWFGRLVKELPDYSSSTIKYWKNYDIITKFFFILVGGVSLQY